MSDGDAFDPDVAEEGLAEAIWIFEYVSGYVAPGMSAGDAVELYVLRIELREGTPHLPVASRRSEHVHDRDDGAPVRVVALTRVQSG